MIRASAPSGSKPVGSTREFHVSARRVCVSLLITLIFAIRADWIINHRIINLAPDGTSEAIKFNLLILQMSRAVS